VPAPEPVPWQGTVYRHLPSGSPYGPLDTRFAARSRENRWNAAGEPTLVLALDRSVLAREMARHVAAARSAELAPLYLPRHVFEIELRLHRVFDLTDPTTLDALGIRDAPECFADRSLARATAGFLRHVRGADGILAPSLAAPERSGPSMLVVFLERLGEPLDSAVKRARPIDIFHVAPREG
jgi:RES domain-containing protein